MNYTKYLQKRKFIIRPSFLSNLPSFFTLNKFEMIHSNFYNNSDLTKKIIIEFAFAWRNNVLVHFPLVNVF